LTEDNSYSLFQAGLPAEMQHAILEELACRVGPIQQPQFGLPLAADVLLDVTIHMLLAASEQASQTPTRNRVWALVLDLAAPVRPSRLLERLEEYDLNFAVGLARATGAMMYLAGLNASQTSERMAGRGDEGSTSYPPISQLVTAITDLLATTSGELTQEIRRNAAGQPGDDAAARE